MQQRSCADMGPGTNYRLRQSCAAINTGERSHLASFSQYYLPCGMHASAKIEAVRAVRVLKAGIGIAPKSKGFPAHQANAQGHSCPCLHAETAVQPRPHAVSGGAPHHAYQGSPALECRAAPGCATTHRGTSHTTGRLTHSYILLAPLNRLHGCLQGTVAGAAPFNTTLGCFHSLEHCHGPLLDCLRYP